MASHRIAAGRAPLGVARLGVPPDPRTAAAGILLLLECLAYLSPDGRRHDARPPAALPALLGDAFAQVMWLVTLTPTGSIDDSFEFNGANGIDTFQISGRTYAAVAAYLDDGVQILDLTDPSNVTTASQIDDSKDSNYELEGASGIDVFEISGRTYAAVASYDDSGVQALHLNLLAANSPPAVYVGPDWFVDEQTAVTLAGTASDPDGDPLTYLWTCRDDNNILGLGTTLSVTFTAPDVDHNDGIFICTLTAIDHHGVAASDRMTLTVRHVPDDRPVLGLIGEYNLTVVLGSIWVDPGATCTTLHDGMALPVTVAGTVDLSTAGTYTLTYTCKHNDRTMSHDRVITVISAAHDEHPTINILNNRGAIPTGLTSPDFGDDAVCTDREDGDISHTITVSVSYRPPDNDGNIRATLTYSCTDSGGNTARDRIDVSVIKTPNNPPELHTNGGLIWIGVGESFTDPGAVCKDVEDGTWNADVVTNSVDTTTAGTYFVVYECVDSGGLRNVGGGARAVYVVAPEQNTPPSITVDDSDILVPLNGTWTIPDATYHDDEDGDLTGRIQLYNVESVNVQKEGTYTFTIFCRDDGKKSDGSEIKEAQVSIRVIVS